MDKMQEIQEFMEKNNIRGAESEEECKARLEKEEAEDRTGIRKYKGTLAWKVAAPARWIFRTVRWGMEYQREYGIRNFVTKKYESSNYAKKKFSKRYINMILPSQKGMDKQKSRKFPKEIKFSILVPLYNTPLRYLKEMVDSVQKQTYGNWELCLADGSDGKHKEVGLTCKEMAKLDRRIVYKKLKKNMGISDNTNACIKMSTGDYICLFDHDDILHPSVLYEYMKAICKEGAEYLYCDEATFLKNDLYNIVTYHFKPDFAPDNLLANNYICHFTCFKRNLLDKTEPFRDRYDGSQDHDMILRLTDVATKVYHVPKLLYFWRAHPNSVSMDIDSKTYAIKAGINAVHDFLASKGTEAKVESTKAFPTIYRIKYEIVGEPKVSILIPNKDHVKELALCIDSILKRTTYKNYEIIVIENNSSEELTREYYDLVQGLSNVRIVDYAKETKIKSFNYSAINNFGAAEATGDYLLLLNNDTEILKPDWIQEMLMFAQREDVGAVGAKLYFSNGTIQHAGIILGFGEHGIAGHSHMGESTNAIGYMGKLHYVQDVSAVTAACLLVSKAKFQEVGGLDENLAVAYNDIDFCVKLREKGYLNIFTPEATLYHHESSSRGADSEGESLKRLDREAEYFKGKWAAVLKKGDPYYNPNLSLKLAWKMKEEVDWKEKK